MLVIVSDLHLTDGTTGLRMPIGAFRTFRERLEDMAYDASKRDENTYRPIEEFDLLLLGDIFDLLRTTQWNNEQKGEPGFARPWTDPNDPALAAKIETIVDGIIEQNSDALDLFHSLAEGTAISLPPANRSGNVDRRVSRDRRSKRRVPVKVNIHYMNGNHDWFFHLPGPGFDHIRGKVIQKMGLINPVTPFPYEPANSPIIQDILQQHSVFAHHGDRHDPFNFVEAKGRNFSCLGDVLLVELFNLFPQVIQKELVHKLPADFFKDLPEIGSIRPSTMTPVWVAGLLERHGVSSQLKAEITDIWQSLVKDVIKVDFLKELDRPGLDWVDAIEVLFNVLQMFSLEDLEGIAPIAERLINFHTTIWGGGELGFDKNATMEDAYIAQEAKYIVFGHTHGFKVLPLRSVQKNGKPFDQFYINSGTWHPLHELGKADPRKRGFITHKTMSYLGFYRNDERKGRAFETWSGNLEI